MDDIDMSQYMTVTEARDHLACSQRAIWRILDRAGRAEVTVRFLGRTLVRRDALPKLEAVYYPFGSENRAKGVREWGHAGGTAKAANAAAAERAKRRRNRKKLG